MWHLPKKQVHHWLEQATEIIASLFIIAAAVLFMFFWIMIFSYMA